MSDRPASKEGAVVCFAVPDESRIFVADLTKRRRLSRAGSPSLPTVSGEWQGRAVTVAHTGVGDSQAARERLASLLAQTEPAPGFVISAGYAGALRPGLPVGDLILAENYSMPSLVEITRACLRGDRTHVGALVTEPLAVETAAAKAALHASTGALAVDMETAWIAEACAVRGLPLLSLRVVSDAADQSFPVPGAVLYDGVRQRPRYLALPAWLALHPGQIAPFARFVRGLGPARERLTRALQTVLARL